MSIRFTFLLAFLINMVMQTGRVVITLFALKLGAQPFTVGALAALIAVMPTLLSWHVGRFCDRFGPRLPLMLSTFAGAFGMLIAYISPGIPALFIASVMYGIMTTFTVVPVQNLVGLQSEPHNSVKNFSNISLVISFVGFAGPLSAGFSLDHAGPRLTCLFLVLLLLVPVLMLMAWGGILPRGTRNTKPMGSVRMLLSESGLWQVLATTSLVVMGIDLFQVYMPIYGHHIGLSASTIGIILASYSLAAFIVRFCLPYLINRFSIEKVLFYSFLIGAAGFMLVPFFKSIVSLSLVSFLFGIGMGCGQPITLVMTYSNATQGRSGEAMGLRLTVNYLTRVICQFLFGSIGSVLGVFSVFWINALMLASGGIASRPGLLTFLRRKKA